METCEFCTITEDNKKNEIYETTYWRVLLTNDQYYLGRCILPLKRHCETLHLLRAEEWVELKRIIDTLEQVFSQEFQATLFNWCCHMNNAFKVTPPRPHVHFHFRPRYQHPVEFHHLMFEDHEFAHSYHRTRTRQLPKDIHQALVVKLQTLFHRKMKESKV